MTEYENTILEIKDSATDIIRIEYGIDPARVVSNLFINFNWKSKRTLGAWCVDYDQTKIGERHIGREIKLNTALRFHPPEAKDTILHEIGHAVQGIVYPETQLTGARGAHGKEWKEIARCIGANPRARCKVNTILWSQMRGTK